MEPHEMVAIVGTLVPVSAILVAGFVAWLWFRNATRRHEEIQKTLRQVIESGQPLSPDVVERLTSVSSTGPVNRREKDLRWGVLLSAVGIGIALYGIFDNGFGPRARLDDVMQMVGVGMLFVLVGLARLWLWKYGPRDKPASHG